MSELDFWPHRGVVMSSRSGLFRRAIECERLMNLSSNPAKKQIFKQLRDMWIALADESRSLSRRAIAEGIAAIEEIQSAFEDGMSKSVH